MLTIAGFDPSSGAGATADLQVFAAHGAFGCSAITALTVQSTLGVRRTEPVQSEVLADTLAALAEDLPPVGIKIGMLATRANVAAVADYLEARRLSGTAVPVVLDPVLRSSSGAVMLDDGGKEQLRSRLLGLVDWVTPNRNELRVLTGFAIGSSGEVETAARTLGARFAGLNVVVTGGDQAEPSDLVVLHGGEARWIPGQHVASRATHGTGCAFSSALLCGLTDVNYGFGAAERAKQYVSEAIRRAEPLGRGLGPMNLLWPLRGPAEEDALPRF